MSANDPNTLGIAPPSATGNAGVRFEGMVGASYLLTLLSSAEPRGLPGAITRTVQTQRAVIDHPLDDIVVHAANADGSQAILEIQAKRTMDFTKSDAEFADVVRRVWNAAQKAEFRTARYQLAVAISRTSTRIERSCQEVLHWARQLTNGVDFATYLGREGFASNGMRDFLAAFRKHLGATGAPTDAETVWRLLRRFARLDGRIPSG